MLQCDGLRGITAAQHAIGTLTLIWVAILILGAAAAAWILLPFSWRRQEERALADQCRKARAIVLSYDDGPGERLTPALLELFQRRGAKASFFMLGKRVSARPAIARQLVADGHDLGSHSESHVNGWKSLPGTWARDVDAGMRSVESAGGSPALFRPPYGKVTLAGWLAHRKRGTRFAWWTVDSQDSWKRRPIAEVLAEIEAKGGGVVLMHDFDSYDSGPDPLPHADHVLALTTAILDLADARNMRVVSLSQLHGEPA